MARGLPARLPFGIEERMERKDGHLVVLGCGFLGERVVRLALEHGWTATALTRNAAQAERLRKIGTTNVVVAALQESGWHDQIQGPVDRVLNCVSSAGGGWEGYRLSYLDGMRSMLDWLRGREDAQTVIFTGSTSVYGQDDGGWVTEESPAHGSTEGAAILREAEDLLLKDSGGRRGFVLRLGGIYGHGRHHLYERARRFPLQRQDGDEGFLNSIHVDDARDAIWAAFASPAHLRGGIYNVVDNAPAQKLEMLEYLHREAAARGSLIADRDAAPPSTRRRGQATNRRISNERARRDFGWEPRFPDYRAGYEAIFADRA